LKNDVLNEIGTFAFEGEQSVDNVLDNFTIKLKERIAETSSTDSG
jgi:hypothetical protein